MENINNKEKNFVSAVVYLRNNETGIVNFVRGLNETLSSFFAKYEIIIVNDCSSDKSVERVKEYAKENEGSAISILNMSFAQGVEQCMNAGLDLAIGDFVFQFDYSHNDWGWELLMDVYRQSLKGFDIVCAVNTKRTKSQPLFYYLFNKYAQIHHKVCDNSFCIITRRGINRVRSLTKQVPYRNALYANCGLGMYNLEYKYESEVVKLEVPRHSYNSLILFTDLGYKAARNMTFLMAGVILFVIIYALVFFFIGHPVEGWTTTMLLLGVSFFGVFAIMAVILKYLSLLTSLVFHKQNYVFESIEKLVNQ